MKEQTDHAGQCRRHRGRPPGPSDTKSSILKSARRLFASDGYNQTSIRAVAAESGVDPALVMYFFSSKQELFRAAIEWPFDIDDVARRIFNGDIGRTGERLVRTMCEIWEDQTTVHPLAVILRNAVQREEAANLLREFVQQEMIGRLMAQSFHRNADLRGSLVHSAIVGLFLTRHVIGVEPLASAPREVVVRAIGPTVQRYLTGVID